MANLKVVFATYGALPGGHQNQAQAFDVSAQLQNLIDAENGIVAISDANFGDPSYGNTKHFGACVNRAGVNHYFACQENQVIDFNAGGGL
jgi:hypothetical protein